MDVARLAAREERAGLLAGGALAVVAVGLVAFALVAWMRTSAGGAVAQPGATPRAPVTSAPAPAAPAGTGRARAAAGPAGTSGSGRADHLPMTARSASLFVPLYRRASETFGVNWRLIASIHQQETSFSSAPGTYRGLNFLGCCAGPMQFNVTNGPVSTWKRGAITAVHRVR